MSRWIYIYLWILRVLSHIWWTVMSIVSKRIGLVTAALVGLAISTVLFAGGAQAAPYSTQPTIAANTQTPTEGGSFTVTGDGYLPGETVDVVLHSTPFALGSAVADLNGDFSLSVTLPSGVSGSHTITSTGVTSGRVATLAVTIDPTLASSALPFTGVAITGIGAIALVALAVGGLMLLVGRRRKTRV